MRAKLPVTSLISASLFFTGVTYASTLPYGAIVASGLLAAGLFALATGGGYLLLFGIAGALASAGAATMLFAHRIVGRTVAAP